jgi:hypothetical protein
VARTSHMLLGALGLFLPLLREKMSQREKMLWAFVAAVLMVSATMSMRSERKGEEARRDKQNEEFERIRSGIQGAADDVTGGDSWVYLDPLPKLRLVNGRKRHTARKVGVTVIDVNEALKSNPTGPFPIKIPLMAPQQCGDISKWGAYVAPGLLNLNVDGGAPSQSYLIDIQAENGKWREWLRIESVNGERKKAIKVVEMNLDIEQEGRLLLEEHDDGFPTNDGTIDW